MKKMMRIDRTILNNSRIIWQLVQRNCMGGGYKVTSAEKLKASQLVEPPLIVGKQYQTQNTVWIYGGGTQNINPKTDNNLIPNIISGHYSEFNSIQSYGFLISGRYTSHVLKYNGVSDAHDGIIITGNNSQIRYIESEQNQLSDNHTTIRGITLLAPWSDVFSTDSWKSETTNSMVRLAQDGVMLAGQYPTLSFLHNHNGVTITGTGGVLEIKNNDGLILSGKSSSESNRMFDEKHQEVSRNGTRVKTNIQNGKGIIIRGALTTSSLNNIQEGSLIEGSSDTQYPTILRGNFILDEKFNLYDKNKNQLVTAGQLLSTINQLQTKVQELEETIQSKPSNV